jgi:GNAT superfamily N-acetyltransferase
MSLTVERVPDAREILAFMHRIYADDPAWVPPVDAWVRRRLDPRKNSFLQSQAEIELYVARRGGEVVGTISALRDRLHEAHRGEAVAFFGWFECVDDPDVARALLDRAAERARAWGAKVLRGPRNLTRIEEMGLTIEGHAFAPPMLAGHHPAYYQVLIEGQGFTPHHDVLAYHIELLDADGRPRPLPAHLEAAAAKVDIPGMALVNPRLTSLSHDIGLAHEVFVEAFRDVPENTPMPRAQFVGLGGGLVLLTDRRMMQVATVNGEAAGFALCFPEMNEAIRAARGRAWPFGVARILAATRTIRTASFKLIGVMKKYRYTGLHALLIREAIAGVRAAGYTRVEGSLIDARNRPMRAVVERAGMEIYKRYRVYDRGV